MGWNDLFEPMHKKSGCKLYSGPKRHYCSLLYFNELIPIPPLMSHTRFLFYDLTTAFRVFQRKTLNFIKKALYTLPKGHGNYRFILLISPMIIKLTRPRCFCDWAWSYPSFNCRTVIVHAWMPSGGESRQTRCGRDEIADDFCWQRRDFLRPVWLCNANSFFAFSATCMIANI